MEVSVKVSSESLSKRFSFNHCNIEKAAVVSSLHTDYPKLRDSIWPFVIVFAFLGAWYLVNDISLRDTISVSLFLYFQTIVGVKVVHHLFEVALKRSGELALGFALGGILFTLIDQIVVNLHLVDWLSTGIIIGLGLLASLAFFQQKPKLSSPDDWRLVLLTPFFITFGYFRNSPGVLFGVMTTIIFFALSYGPGPKKSIVVLRSLALLSLFSFLLIVLVAKLRTESYGEWMLRALYAGTDDQIFSESLSWSLAKFGLSEYPAAASQSIRYHWFSLAWSGLVSKVTGAEPFVVTLHVVPTTSFVIISWGLFQLSKLLSTHRQSAFLTIFTLFASASVIEPLRFVHVVNTSNVVPFIWVVLLIVCLHFHYLHELRYPTLVIPLIIGVLLISKVPFGVSSLVATSACVILINAQRLQKQNLLLLANCWVVAIVSYILFLSPHPWERRQFTLDSSIGGFAPLSPFTSIIGIGAIVAWFAPLTLALLSSFRKTRSSSNLIIITFLISGSFMAIFRFLLEGTSAELYFANFGIFCVAPLVGLSLGNIFARADSAVRLAMVSVAIVSVLLMLSELTLKPISRYAGTDLVLIFIPPAFGMFFMILRKMSNPRWDLPGSISVGFLVILSMSLAVALNRFYPEEVLVSPARVASTDEIDALQWLRKNSTSDSILATNLTLCRDALKCTTDQSRFVTSAFSRRRVFIEGPRFVIGGLPYPDWATRRIKTSLDFAAKPSKRDLDFLRQHGVSWFVLGIESGSSFTRKDWDNFGVVRYETSSIKVIELRTS